MYRKRCCGSEFRSRAEVSLHLFTQLTWPASSLSVYTYLYHYHFLSGSALAKASESKAIHTPGLEESTDEKRKDPRNNLKGEDLGTDSQTSTLYSESHYTTSKHSLTTSPIESGQHTTYRSLRAVSNRTDSTSLCTSSLYTVISKCPRLGREAAEVVRRYRQSSSFLLYAPPYSVVYHQPMPIYPPNLLTIRPA